MGTPLKELEKFNISPIPPAPLYKLDLGSTNLKDLEDKDKWIVYQDGNPVICLTVLRLLKTYLFEFENDLITELNKTTPIYNVTAINADIAAAKTRASSDGQPTLNNIEIKSYFKLYIPPRYDLNIDNTGPTFINVTKLVVSYDGTNYTVPDSSSTVSNLKDIKITMKLTSTYSYPQARIIISKTNGGSDEVFYINYNGIDNNALFHNDVGEGAIIKAIPLYLSGGSRKKLNNLKKTRKKSKKRKVSKKTKKSKKRKSKTITL